MSKVTENVIFMDRGNYTTCTVHLQGGTILSYRVKNQEMLFMRRGTSFNSFTPIRGGIKLTFPYFGTRVNGPKHGFARYVPWHLDDGPFVNADGNVEVVISLKESEYTKSIWNYKFKITTRLTLCMNELRIAIKVENTSNYFPFSFTALRHSIFRAVNVKKCEIYGLVNCKYVSLLDETKTVVDPDPDQEKLMITGVCLNLYLDAPTEVEIRNIDDNGLKLKVKSLDPTATDVLIYNPWDANVWAGDSVYSANEYLHFLGVGNGHLCSDIRLEPKQSWESHYLIEVVNEEHDKKIEKLGALLDNPIHMFKEVCKKTDTYFSPRK